MAEVRKGKLDGLDRAVQKKNSLTCSDFHASFTYFLVSMTFWLFTQTHQQPSLSLFTVGIYHMELLKNFPALHSTERRICIRHIRAHFATISKDGIQLCIKPQIDRQIQLCIKPQIVEVFEHKDDIEAVEDIRLFLLIACHFPEWEIRKFSMLMRFMDFLR